MRITKYPQSCLVVDDGGRRLLIDPGSLAMDAHSFDDFGQVNAVLYTHQHGDHFDERSVAAVRERDIPVYANADVVSQFGQGNITEVTDGEKLDVAGFEVVARDLPHCLMVDGSEGPPNTGFVVDGTFFHPGDGTALDGLRVDVLAVPIGGPDVSNRDAYRFVKSTGATRAVPIHYDYFVADPDLFAQQCDLAEVVVIANGESAEF